MCNTAATIHITIIHYSLFIIIITIIIIMEMVLLLEQTFHSYMAEKSQLYGPMHLITLTFSQSPLGKITTFA